MAFEKIIGFLCAFSGTRRDALQLAPQGKGQTATIGLLLLLTGAAAWATSGYALYQAFLGDSLAWFVAIAGGLGWAAIVVCIDRLLILGLSKLDEDGRRVEIPKLLLQALPRMVLAIAVAFTLSTPVLLRVCRSVIEMERRAEQRAVVNEEKAANAIEAGLPASDATLADVRQRNARQEQRLQGEPDSYECREAKDAVARADSRYRGTASRCERAIAGAREEMVRLRSRESLAPEEARRISILGDRIGAWQREVALSAAELGGARAREAEARRQWVEIERGRLEALRAELAKTRKQAEETGLAVGVRNASDAKQIGEALAPTLINQYRVLSRITSNPQHRDARSVALFSQALHLLFLLLELTPLLVKSLSRITPLDHAVVALEMEDRERVVLAALSRTASRQRLHAAAAEVDEVAVSAWRAAHSQAFRKKNLDWKELRAHRSTINALLAESDSRAGQVRPFVGSN